LAVSGDAVLCAFTCDTAKRRTAVTLSSDSQGGCMTMMRIRGVLTTVGGMKHGNFFSDAKDFVVGCAFIPACRSTPAQGSLRKF